VPSRGRGETTPVQKKCISAKKFKREKGHGGRASSETRGHRMEGSFLPGGPGGLEKSTVERQGIRRKKGRAWET